MRRFRPSRRVFLAATGAAGLAAISSAHASRRSERFLAHEWGTFTTLQDEDGKELHGINIDDEPVPDFVHNLNPFLLSKPLLSSRHWQYRQKAAPRHHPYVTMRLETPVIYFYPPVGQVEPMNIDVHVRFRGGWLTEFYPQATPHAPLLKEGQFDFGNLTPDTVSSLTWSDLTVGKEVTGPSTDEHVWLAPRKVDAAGISTREGESEKYLFYRGVGCQQAPLRIALDRSGGRIKIHSRMSPALIGEQKAKFAVLWVAHVKPDGTSAFRTLDGFEATRDGNPALREASYRFEAGEYARENQEKLHAAMHNALVEDGLFSDEATALLSTWQRAYFTSPGLRVFYLVPRAWTDFYLPLSITPSPEGLVRTMMGRIELISDEQRQMLGELSDTPIGKGDWVDRIPQSAALERFMAGRADFGDLGVEIPKEYKLYLALGRFRNALVTAEEARRPSPSLTVFINEYGLYPFRVKR